MRLSTLFPDAIGLKTSFDNFTTIVSTPQIPCSVHMAYSERSACMMNNDLITIPNKIALSSLLVAFALDSKCVGTSNVDVISENICATLAKPIIISTY